MQYNVITERHRQFITTHVQRSTRST